MWAFIWAFIWSLSGNYRVQIHSKGVCGMMITYSQMHRTDKSSQCRLIIWSVWLNNWVFVYELIGCGFESRYCHLNFRYRGCFEQGVLWYSGNYRVQILLRCACDMIITYRQFWRCFNTDNGNLEIPEKL